MQVPVRDSRLRIGIAILMGLLFLQMATALVYIVMMLRAHACTGPCFAQHFLRNGFWPIHMVILPLNILLLGGSLFLARRYPSKNSVWVVPYLSMFTLPLGVLSLLWLL